MKVMLINGSPHEHGCTYTALSEAQMTLKFRGIETELLWIGAKPVAGCIDCHKCHGTGKCIFDDGINYISENIAGIDAFIVGAPVFYAGPCGQICAFLDRLFVCCGKRMAGKPRASVVSCRRGGASASFDRLNKYFTIAKMPVASSQYWNSVHGNTPEEVRRDLEGLQTMRTLAENMAWLLGCIEAGQKNGLPLPQYETGISTNFIR